MAVGMGHQIATFFSAARATFCRPPSGDVSWGVSACHYCGGNTSAEDFVKPDLRRALAIIRATGGQKTCRVAGLSKRALPCRGPLGRGCVRWSCLGETVARTAVPGRGMRPASPGDSIWSPWRIGSCSPSARGRARDRTTNGTTRAIGLEMAWRRPLSRATNLFLPARDTATQDDYTAGTTFQSISSRTAALRSAAIVWF